MDVVLRARHDALVAEFPCVSTELRLVKTPAGGEHPRTIEAFCADSRAAAFGGPLESFEVSCSACIYLCPQPATADSGPDESD
jgi:hypothetical protein